MEGLVGGGIFEDGAEFFGVGAAENGGAEVGSELGVFGERDAAFVEVSLAAPDEALGEDGEKGAGDLVGFDRHFEEAGDGGGGVAGVESGDEAVAGEGGLDGERGGGGVADFAEHEDLRVLAEDGLEGAVVGELAVGRDFDLRDAGDEAFGRGLRGEMMEMPKLVAARWARSA